MLRKSYFERGGLFQLVEANYDKKLVTSKIFCLLKFIDKLTLKEENTINKCMRALIIN